MPRTSAILGAPLHHPGGDHGDPSASPAAFAARITAINTDTVDIVVPGYSERHDYAGVQYAAAAAPAVDDACVAVFTDGREPFVLIPGSAARTYTITNVTTSRSYDANATTLDGLADTLGTLIADLRERGLVL
jgi:hypothetical protein